MRDGRHGLGWPALGALAVAAAALGLNKGVWVTGLFLIPALAGTLVPARVTSRPLAVFLRLILFTAAVLLAFLVRTDPLDEFFDGQGFMTFALLAAAELAVQAWLPKPHTGWITALPCVIFFTGSNTYAGAWTVWLAPLFLALLVLAFRESRPRVDLPARLGVLLVTSIGVALVAGFLTMGAVVTFRNQLNILGEQVLSLQVRQGAGLSSHPVLERTFGNPGSPLRVLRISNRMRDVLYLRGAAFDTYRLGRWEPELPQRDMRSMTDTDRHIGTGFNRFTVHTLEPMDRLVLSTIETTGIETADTLSWSPERGGPIVADQNNLPTYQVTFNRDNTTRLWGPPSAKERERLLVVPPEVSISIRQLARVIGGRQRKPLQRVQAVTLHLVTRGHYSLQTDPGAGDPLSNFFIKNDLTGHCEYFASAAVILLRCLDVPTRYVVGYYAHERQSDGSIIVRQRDAHAWAESWIDGVGWVTVEATPAGGRPDAVPEAQVSPWRQGSEWLQDQARVAKAWLADIPRSRLWLAAGGAMVIYLLLVLGRREQRRRQELAALDYTPGDAALAALEDRFTVWLTRRGTPCPPGRPWREHLLTVPAHDAAGHFVDTYNLARFGPAPDAETLAILEALLADLEKDIPHAD